MKLLTGSAIHDEVIEQGAKVVRQSLWFATANVKDMHLGLDDHVGSVVELFADLCRRRVEIRLLHSSVPSGPFLAELKKYHQRLPHAFFQMRRCPRVHFKMILLDARRLYMGSANLTGAGIGIRGEGRRNFEMGILTDSSQAIDEAADYFLNVWDGHACRVCKLKKHCAIPLSSPFDPK
ncbi:MAG TPA: phospholipase D family protein [bacterium]|nr:phospholipase D family protein [bacterium]